MKRVGVPIIKKGAEEKHISLKYTHVKKKQANKQTQRLIDF